MERVQDILCIILILIYLLVRCNNRPINIRSKNRKSFGRKYMDIHDDDIF